MRFSGRTLAVTAGLGLALAWAPVTALAEEAPAEQGSELQSIEVTLPNMEQSQTPTVTTPSDVPAPSEDVISDDSTMGSVSDTQEPETNLPSDGQAGETEGDPSGSLPVEGETEGDGVEGTQTDGETTTDDGSADDVTPEDGVVTPGGEADPSGEGAGESGTIKLETPELSLSQSATPTTPEPAASQSIQNSWVKEENGSYSWYGEDGKKQESGWVETNKLTDGSVASTIKRFWIESGSLLISQVFDVLEGNTTSWYYATEYGYIALGKYTDKKTGKIYLADAETGRLQNPNAGSQWYVGDAYDGGMQRYWIDMDHSVKTGFFSTADGKLFHGNATKGYVDRGVKVTEKGKIYLMGAADGAAQDPNAGSRWYVGGDYDGGTLQRYWINEDHSVQTGFFSTADGKLFHGNATKGYVDRGVKVTEKGKIYLMGAADGAAQDPNAGSRWYVGGDYDGGEFQRYWINDDYSVKTGLFYTADGYGFIGHDKEGYVVRGKTPLNGKIYLSDNGGRLQTPNAGSRWYVGGDYDGGEFQRYWINDDYSVKTGVFQTGDGKWFYAGAKEGYVLRGKNTYDGRVYLSDNGGSLEGPGWIVTDIYDGGMQRYWIIEDATLGRYAKAGTFEVGGQWFVGLSKEGYVLRGKGSEGGKFYVSDASSGVLISPTDGNWYVGGAYDGGTFQRYWVNDDHSVKTGFFTVNGQHFYGIPTKGYVARGKYAFDSKTMLLADNGGVLYSGKTGFVTTSAYDGTAKKYYFREITGTDVDGKGTVAIGAGIGFIVLDGGKTEYYGSTTEGYIMTGTFTTPTGIVVTTDADGKVTAKGTSVVFEALRRLNASYSDTNWAICVDVHAHEVMVFNRANKNSAWTLARQFKCGTGNTAAGTPTFRGELTLGGGWSPSANKYLPAEDRIYKYDYFGAWYYMPYYLDQGFHSVIDGDMDGYVSPSDTASQVGKDISHGCIRCPMDDLRWVWENVPDGSRVIIYPYSTNGVYYRAGF